MLANPGAEQGPAATDSTSTAAPPGWSPSPGMTQVVYGTSGFPGTDVSAAIGGASALFAGGDAVPASSGYQIISLTAAAASIDAGRAGRQRDPAGRVQR
jgi:hypothetical protein